MLEHPFGGVVLIGGASGLLKTKAGADGMNSLFRLTSPSDIW
jgi:hypothetical protein